MSTETSEVSSTPLKEDGICLDLRTAIYLDTAAVHKLHNEIQVLAAWVDGLYFLYKQVRLMESHSRFQFAEPSVENAEEVTAIRSQLALPNLACCFQWYAVTLCNFVELVGAIGWELDPSKKPPRDYIKEVIPDVLAYRNLVAAHLGRAREKKANAAEKLLSLLPPSSLINGRYTAGALSTYIRRGGNSSTGSLPAWSLTKTHESLSDRYWPEVKLL